MSDVDSEFAAVHAHSEKGEATRSAALNSAKSDVTFPIVGIGASAGGLEALEAFFDNMPPDSGMAFVVIQHLSPDFKSLMDELLRRHTKLAIHRVENGMSVEPNAIYLIPPKKEMIISGRRLLLTDKDPGPGLTLPIDTFFRSLAQDVGDRAVGIILSGTGSDGSRSIRDIHASGGLVLAQSVESARFDGMPKSAIDTEIVDIILPPEEMPAALLRYARDSTTREHLAESIGVPVNEDGLNEIFRLLREQYGIDFTYYKPSTVARRIDRRLQMNHSMSLETYVEQLRSDPNELNALYRDLLIGVTQFFRDPEAFSGLERDVIPHLLAAIPAAQEIRIWVAGCATGEEAYSLAILVHEFLSASRRPINVRIFATDVHPSSLEFASLGVYSEASLAEMNPVRRDRYFTRHGQSFQISQELRKMIVFAPHNVIKDAPFTKLDLVTCRNLLIYLQPPAQKKALSLFHFALKTGGVLFLGPSETPGELADEFDTVDNHWRIYRKRRDIRLPADMRLPLSVGYATPMRMGMIPALTTTPPDAQLMRVYDALLDEFIPPSLLLNERGELVHTFKGAGAYLQHRDGRMTNNVLEMVSDDLKIALAGALQRAVKEGTAVKYNGVRFRNDEGESKLRITVRPVSARGGGAPHMVVTLETASPPPRMSEEVIPEIDVERASRARLQTLETELQYTRENLQSTVEELETSNEELQATNEELLASNEELQSTNEELHSVNEELYTVNAEYQRKIVELTELTDDMENLLRSTDVAVIFLDRDLCIRKFTPQIARAFQVLPQDIGRRIESFSHNIDHPSLIEDVRRVLETAKVFEKPVRDRTGNWFLLRVLPYVRRSLVNGVVLTLIDISGLMQVENELRMMSKVFRDGADPIVVEDLSGRLVDVNFEAERVLEWSRDELVGQDSSRLVPDEYQAENATIRRKCLDSDSIRNIDSIWKTRSGREIPVLMTLSRLSSDSGEPTRIARIAKDISLQKQAEESARNAVKRRDQFLAMLSHELRNPLGAVLNATRIIEQPKVEPETIRRACAVIQRQSQQMSRLLDDLLDVSRVTQGKIVIRPAPLDLTRLVPDVVHAVRPLIEARRHDLHVSVPDQPLFILGDASRLLQIQENLLTNAAKYTPPHGTIWYSVEREENQAVIRLRDTGVGMPKHMFEAVFDLFVQSNETLDRSEGGMGVGLTLVKNLVALHGGHVSAQSEGPGKGSEFVVRLPLCATPDRNTSELQPPTDGAARRRILLVEDNPDSRETLRMLLKLFGHEIFTAKDGIAGLDAIRQHRPDIAIVDIGLPGLDGYQIARRVRDEFGSDAVYLVALTGYGRPEDRQAALAAGFDEHLVKPPRNEDLLRVIGQAAGAP